MADRGSDRRNEFRAFVEAQGDDLHKLALFQTLYDIKSTYIWGGWTAWEDEFQNPNSPAVRKFAEEYADRIRFFKYLQFEADRQFKQASAVVAECGLKVGLYRDLAVGVGKDSAELWSDNDLFIRDVGAGAPPDAFFPAGQKWCLGAFNPYVLKERCYEPFIKILRANMNAAGALRIDHVMGLMRLYIIPDNGDAGTYVMYNFKDMLNIVAIESCRNKCQIVGESIGNVPEGFLETLAEKNIYALSVLWAERKDAGWGDFNAPGEYPEKAFMSVGTHDMAPLRITCARIIISTDRDIRREKKRRFTALQPRRRLKSFWRSWKISSMLKKCKICRERIKNIPIGAANFRLPLKSWKGILLISAIFRLSAAKDKMKTPFFS